MQVLMFQSVNAIILKLTTLNRNEKTDLYPHF